MVTLGRKELYEKVWETPITLIPGHFHPEWVVGIIRNKRLTSPDCPADFLAIHSVFVGQENNI